jgi:hypothetical protein
MRTVQSELRKSDSDSIDGLLFGCCLFIPDHKLLLACQLRCKKQFAVIYGKQHFL